MFTCTMLLVFGLAGIANATPITIEFGFTVTEVRDGFDILALQIPV